MNTETGLVISRHRNTIVFHVVKATDNLDRIDEISPDYTIPYDFELMCIVAGSIICAHQCTFIQLELSLADQMGLADFRMMGVDPMALPDDFNEAEYNGHVSYEARLNALIEGFVETI